MSMNYVEHLDKRKVKPKIGKVVYAIYDNIITEEEVIALSNDFFISKNYKNTDVAPVDKILYDDFETQWFNTLSKAKEYLSQNFDMNIFKVSEREGNKGERYWIFVDKNERKPRKTKNNDTVVSDTTNGPQVVEKVVEKIVEVPVEKIKEVIKEVPVVPENMVSLEEVNAKFQNQKEYNIKITELKILTEKETIYTSIYKEYAELSNMKPAQCVETIKKTILPKYLSLQDTTMQNKVQAQKELKEITNKNKRKK